jgi:hypothetical protein
MPTLKNQRHELFCRNLIEGAQRGWSATDAYIKAGYKGEEGVARACASRLLTNENVKRRLEELNAPAVKKTQITVETLLNKLEANIIGAEAKGQHGAVNGSIGLMAQLRGLLINRTEIGSPGSFDACETTEQVVAALLADQSPAQALSTLALLQQEVEAYAARNATLVPAAEPARPREPGTEAERSLALWRRRR